MDNLKVISVKTQVRRLRYFFLCIDFLKKSGSPKIIFQKKIHQWVANNKVDFKKLYSSTGEITQNKRQVNSQSFNNYLEAFNKFGLSEELNDLLVPTKICTTLKVLQNLVNAPNSLINNYELTENESVEITYVILRQDRDVFVTILKQLLDLQEPTRLVGLKKSYKRYYISHLNKVLNTANYRNTDKILEVIKRVKAWRNEERYLEDIIPSRLNWMLDIGIIDQELFKEEGKYFLNLKGIEFCKSLELDDIYEEHYFNRQIFSLSKLMNNYNFSTWEDLDEESKFQFFKESIFFVIDRFSSLKLPRYSVEQTFLFISLYNLFEKKIIIEFDDIEKFLANEVQIENKIFSLRKSARESESYISVRNV